MYVFSVYVCVSRYKQVCVSPCGQLRSFDSLLPLLCKFWELNSDCQDVLASAFNQRAILLLLTLMLNNLLCYSLASNWKCYDPKEVMHILMGHWRGEADLLWGILSSYTWEHFLVLPPLGLLPVVRSSAAWSGRDTQIFIKVMLENILKPLNCKTCV